MEHRLDPICELHVPCKCCGEQASLYGVVDFHKNCEIVRRKVLDPSGIPIYYHRCPACGFLFTVAFDHFTHDDFRRHIYNADYGLVDPDYLDTRPRSNATGIGQMFAGAKDLRILDYGGGNGLFAELLRGQGFALADSYDPFVAEHSTKPAHRYSCVISFEVVEHSHEPARTFPGMILFSTLIQPPNIDQMGLGWWYAGPRNGHVSLYSKASLEAVARPHGFKFASFNDNLHVLWRELPEFAKAFIRG
jgi:2-polyprenyl-6-hydroxyphenyl methylase/3-demethylubiquinone-9 3-methyltransferase